MLGEMCDDGGMRVEESMKARIGHGKCGLKTPSRGDEQRTELAKPSLVASQDK